MIEYERKILLRKLNFGELADSGLKFTEAAILQGYSPDGTRYRRTILPIEDSAGMTIEYHETKKVETNKFEARKETEREISLEEFRENFDKCITFVDKVRCTIPMDDYEIVVDSFYEEVATLTLCEIEILRSDVSPEVINELNNIQLPDFIEREIIMDVTKFDEFKNKNLAVPVNNINKEAIYV